MKVDYCYKCGRPKTIILETNDHAEDFGQIARCNCKREAE